MKKSILVFVFTVLLFITADNVFAKTDILTIEVYDQFDNPVPHISADITINGKTYVKSTDFNGIVNTPLSGGFPYECKVETRFEYTLNGRTVYVLGLLNEDGYLMHVKNIFNITIKNKDELKQHLKIESINKKNQRYNNEMIKIYQYLSDSVKFFNKELNIYETHDISPCYIACYAGDENRGSYYNNNIIIISESDMPVNNTNAPQNREWHEYNHHVMLNIYKKWPKASMGYEKNHGGYVNTTTSDSYVEGFAEFLSLVVGDYNGYDFGSVYQPIGDFELDYLPVDYAGTAEEFSIAAILWDLYDGKNDDNVNMHIKDMWRVLSRFSNDFTAVYEKFVRVFPDLKEDIDDVFIQHGFFILNEPGNGKYDFGEPFINSQWPDTYNNGEYFIDLPMRDDEIAISYNPGQKVGSAGDVSRPLRRTTTPPIGHCIKTDNKNSCYVVDVHFNSGLFNDYSMKASNVDGEIKFAVPPKRYDSVISVKPEGVECEKILKIKTKDFYSKYQKSVKNRYYMNHDFVPSDDEVKKEDDFVYYSEPDIDEPVLDEDGRVINVFQNKSNASSSNKVEKYIKIFLIIQILTIVAATIVVIRRKRLRR